MRKADYWKDELQGAFYVAEQVREILPAKVSVEKGLDE